MLSKDKTLPKTVKVGHRNFRVHLATDLQDEMTGRMLLGNTWAAGDTINIEDDIPRDLAPEVMLHEVLHLYWDQMGLKSKADEETAVSAMAKAFCIFCKDNPKLISWILTRLKEK